jgi:hypothetical protein
MDVEILFLALASLLVGVILAFVAVFVALYLGIDIFENLWLLAAPVILAVILNITFIELYRKHKRK